MLLFFLNQQKGCKTSRYTPSLRNNTNDLLNSSCTFPSVIKINKRKKKPVPENNYIKVIDLIEGKIERKKYIAFSGKGKLLGASFIEEYKENVVSQKYT